MKSSFELLYIVMKSDEGFSDMLDKTILIQYQYENVTLLKLMNLKKAAILQPFFLKSINKLENLKYIHP